MRPAYRAFSRTLEPAFCGVQLDPALYRWHPSAMTARFTTVNTCRAAWRWWSFNEPVAGA